MKLRPEEITSILKERIEKFDVETDLAEVGNVLQVGDGIARIHGLENAVALEMLELQHLQRDRVLKAVDAGDPVAHLEDVADLGQVGLDVELLDSLLEDRGDLFRP